MTHSIVESIRRRIRALELENRPRNARGYYDMPMSLEEYELLERYIASLDIVRDTDAQLRGTLLVFGAECYIGCQHSFSLPTFGPRPKIDANREGY